MCVCVCGSMCVFGQGLFLVYPQRHCMNVLQILSTHCCCHTSCMGAQDTQLLQEPTGFRCDLMEAQCSSVHVL